MANNATVAHNWAHQTGRNTQGSNFYYEGTTIYSYGPHFPIASLSEDGMTVFFTTRKYGNTTNKHKSIVRSSVNHLNAIECERPIQAANGIHEQNLEYWRLEVNKIKQKDLSRCKVHKLFNELTDVLTQADRYIEYFKIDNLSWLTEARQFIQELMASDKYRLEEEIEAAKQQRKAEIDSLRVEISLAKFRSGEIKYFSSPTQYLYLNGDNVCTSLGVCIPVREFTVHYQRLINKEKMVGNKVDNKFTITLANENLLVIGCHKITRDEIDSIATQLNLI